LSKVAAERKAHMKVKFIGNPAKNADGSPVDTSEYVNNYGVKFKLGEVQDISKLPKNIQEKFAGNPHFEVIKGGG
jgi:hypothetical protein